ncbi:hypothetical protein M8R19_11945 [Pseudomonas sp. R3.Fl]|uniref:hypothetical protein n=1 Tax=Pseudomonas sp. R3.Fl TaxID=2928708 RepID=UPI00201E4C1C|nr:hypothetical protein [Pseudomonas sp. R3.Fl]MCL6689421.1 hypothetical protein [Pseudomonas sp. R3.Fl]
MSIGGLNKKETLVPWEAESSIPRVMHLDKIVDSAEGLGIFLARDLGSPERILFLFQLKELVGYSVVNDSYTWKRSAERECPGGCSVYIVEGSKDVVRYQEETFGVTDMSGAKHYCFVLDEEEINFVSFSPPEVRFENF